jgi:SAM-dependent methyltransferase
MDIDFGRTAKDYGQYRAGFPAEFYARVSTFGVGLPGQQLLDLGTGTGTLARGFALRGCTVTGLDRSPALITEAERLDACAGVSVRYVTATAEATGLPDRSFDVVTAGQCWHWFDRERAAREAHRLLVREGRLVIAHFDWIPLPGNVVEATEQLIERHNPAWTFGGGYGLYPVWLRDVAMARFQDIETFSFDVPVAYTHEGWRGRIRASAGVAASLPPDQVARFDTELHALLRQRFAADPLQVPHRVFALIARA